MRALVVALCLVLAPAAAWGEERGYDEAMREAKEAFGSGEYGRALRAAEEALRRKRSTPREAPPRLPPVRWAAEDGLDGGMTKVLKPLR